MATAQRKTDLSPLESLVVERALGDDARANTTNGPLARIQALTQERQRLYARSAAHPFLAATNRARVLAISAEIERLWEVVRRQRAARRLQIERALHVSVEDDDDQSDHDDASESDERKEQHDTDAA
ncbi:MAG TPA: hypothetical protein VKQ36_04495 [Ktedonobacterales bacterium]|nr:hypothetical protein [Ktedonobacterales bacterium]